MKLQGEQAVARDSDSIHPRIVARQTNQPHSLRIVQDLDNTCRKLLPMSYEGFPCLHEYEKAQNCGSYVCNSPIPREPVTKLTALSPGRKLGTGDAAKKSWQALDVEEARPRRDHNPIAVARQNHQASHTTTTTHHVIVCQQHHAGIVPHAIIPI
jgi:hypothetical protein